MGKVIAVDIDEVLADFLSDFLYFHRLMYKTTTKREDFKNYYLHDVLGIEREEMHIRYLEFKTFSLFERLKPIKGAKNGIKYLLKKGYEVQLLTARTREIEKETRKWLDVYFKGIDLPLNFSRDKDDKFINKSIVCKEIGAEIIIEDHIDNALDCAKNGVKVFLMDAPWNQTVDLPDNVIRVKSWKEITEKL